MKQSIVYKAACFIKNTFQVFTSAVYGWVMAWWFLNAAAYLTDIPDRAEEAADIKIFGLAMLVSGIITFAVKEVIMYKINRDWKKYMLFSIAPLIITAAAGYYYIMYCK